MTSDPLAFARLERIALDAREGGRRDVAAVVADIAALPAGSGARLASERPLEAEEAAALFRALHAAPRRFAVRLSLGAVESRALLEEAARAGCLAIEIAREGGLVGALATGLEPADGDRLVAALRRARGLGIATVLDLPLGLAADDEGVFERAVRFCRRALVSIPVVHAAAEPGAAGDAAPRMDRATLDNGIRWTRRRLTRQRAIWRRALWPGGTRRLALRAGYLQRRALRRDPEARYTPTMFLLRTLNRTARARARHFLATSATPGAGLARDRRRAWLRTRAGSDGRLHALVIRLEGALDLRGARRLTKRVRQALRAGYERVTIDVHGIDAVSLDVVTRFTAENQVRLLRAAGRVRIENVREKLAALRSQIGDHEGLRILETAFAA